MTKMLVYPSSILSQSWISSPPTADIQGWDSTITPSLASILLFSILALTLQFYFPAGILLLPTLELALTVVHSCVPENLGYTTRHIYPLPWTDTPHSFGWIHSLSMLVIFIAPAAQTTMPEITDITLQPEMISRLARFWFRCLVFFTCNWFLFTVRLYFLSSFSGNVFGSPLLFSGLSFVCLFFLPKRFGKRVFLLADG